MFSYAMFPATCNTFLGGVTFSAAAESTATASFWGGLGSLGNLFAK